MSRFNNLEFGHEPEDRSISQPQLKDATYYLNEADRLFVSGRFEGALRAYSKMLEFDARNAAAWTGQVRMLIELGEYKEAKLWADKALEVLPDHAELLAAKAVALARTGDLKSALMFSDAALESQGTTAYLWLARGDVLLARKEKRAEFCFEKALSFASERWLQLWLISRIYSFYQQFSRALKMAQQALALDGARAVVWVQLGRCQMALGLVGPSEQSFAHARELDPECPQPAAFSADSSQSFLWSRLLGWWRQCLRK